MGVNVQNEPLQFCDYIALSAGYRSVDRLPRQQFVWDRCYTDHPPISIIRRYGEVAGYDFLCVVRHPDTNTIF